MILYQLGCEADHRFESWFRDSTAYDEQLAAGHLTCPVCGSLRVGKTIMAPAVVASRSRRASAMSPGPRMAGPPSPPMPMPPIPAGMGLLDEKGKAVRAFLKGVRDRILSDGQDVGARFPDQARRMHDGDIPMRQIHGKATPEEARDLVDDGIMIMPIPVLPEELN